MDENAVMHLKCNGLDVCMFHRYASVTSGGQKVEGYKNIYVVAWSLGVWMAARWMQRNPINVAGCVAINGTLNPVSDAQGIPRAIFLATLTTWNQKKPG
ncbi:MAG: DUF452 family protein [Bacteroidales bacterium]|nr:DUF452 family protein [Bacteroidales bacterium]